MNESEFQSLLQKAEGETIDFKAIAYDLSSDYSKFAFVKDVISLANTPREEDSFIVLGVKRLEDGTNEMRGCPFHADEATLQSQLSERVSPIPSISYEIVIFRGREFGIVRVRKVRVGPSVPLKDFGDGLRRWQIYFRRGSKNDNATPEDIGRILDWFGKSIRPGLAYRQSGPSWDAFLREVHDFESGRHFVLVTTRLPTGPLVDCAVLGSVPWTAAFDFDSESDSSGLLTSVRPTLQARRSLHLVTTQDRPTLNLRAATYWFFAGGLSGRDSIDITKWNVWQKSFGAALTDHVSRLAGACAPTPVTFVVLLYDVALGRHMRTLLESVLGAFGGLTNIVMLGEEAGDIQGLANDLDASLVEMPVHQLCSGLRSIYDDALQSGVPSHTFPSSSGAPLDIQPKDLRWLEEEFEIVTLESGQFPSADRTIARDFLRGNEISSYELGLHCDVERDIEAKLNKQVRSDLDSRRTVRINLYHAPGAGGTTLGKRILWNSRRENPCLQLRSTIPVETADRIAFVTASTGLSALVAIDGSDIAESAVDELYDQLKARNIPVTLLQIVRRFTVQSEGPRSFFLKEELSSAEAQRFKSVFGREEPGRLTEIDKLLIQPNPRFRTAFYFGLVTFLENFRGLEPYLSARLQSLTEDQRKIIGFIAIAHHYGQKPLPAQSFADFLQIPKSRKVELNSAIPARTLELLVELDAGIWRTAHDLVAVEALKQLLWPSSADRRLWKQNLSRWAKEFAAFCRSSDPIASEEMLEVVRRVFVYRDNSELLGTERAGLNHFAQLIEDIPSREGALEVLRQLTVFYPNEAHFWAHLGRYYSVEQRDFVSAAECIDRALLLRERDQVLHHMKGMALRQQVYDLIEREKPITTILTTTKLAGESFASARELAPDDEHGYISEAQMILRVLDYAGRTHGGDVFGYMSSSGADPFVKEAFERAEELLERVRRNREGQGASPFEEKCRAQLDVLYGRHDHALQMWDGILSRKETYAPPIRRQIVWTYLARRQRSWYALDHREIDRILRLLEQNLEEEPQLDTNLRLWVQAVRRAKTPPNIEAVIERVGYWRANANSLESVFYSYVFYALQSIDGSALAMDAASRFIDESRNRTRFNRNRTKSLEWFGKGTGITRLVHHSQLGNWDKNRDFWENASLLARITGRITRIDAPQSGEIEVQGGLRAFFVPARGNYSRGRSENQSVSFYLGFSYEGLRAWEVKDF